MNFSAVGEGNDEQQDVVVAGQDLRHVKVVISDLCQCSQFGFRRLRAEPASQVPKRLDLDQNCEYRSRVPPEGFDPALSGGKSAVLSNGPAWGFWVGTAGFEPATSASRTLRAAKLRYVPNWRVDTR